jgi:hypothetical protein
MSAKRKDKDIIFADCVLIQARDVREGDRVRHFAPYADYTVEEINTSVIGLCFTHGDGTASSTYLPQDMLWITRREEARA